MSKKYLAISAIGRDQPGLIDRLSQQIFESGCNLEDSRMSVLGGEFALVLLISGNWNHIAKLEELLPQMRDEMALLLSWKPTEARQTGTDLLPYMVEVIAMDHPGIVHHLTHFFAQRKINVEDMATASYPAPHTGTPMFSLRMTVGIPAALLIAQLREEFFDLCDQLNLDAVIEPVRG